MTRRGLDVALAAACTGLFPVACGPRPASVGDGGESAGGQPDVPADLPPACEPPLVECDGQCADLRNDPDNCGRCGYGCWIVTPGNDVPDERGVCTDGWCSPKIGESCVPSTTATTCAERCQTANARCVAGGCFDSTIVWVASYRECLENFDTCQEPQSTGCFGDPVDLVTYQNVSCDTPIDEAFVQTGLPPKPPEQTEGPYAGWIPSHWNALCCCEPYHFD